MGILYNRFTPPKPSSLIPYSDQSKIVTYLSPDSFMGSSSTVWGNNYPVPMVRGDSSVWSLNSDNSVRLSTPGSLLTSGSFAMDTTTVTQATYTVYMVVKYNAENTDTSFPNLTIVRSTSPDFYIYRAYQDNVNVRFGSVNISTLTPSSSAFGNYHVYAFRQQRSSSTPSQGVYHHAVDDGSLVLLRPTNPPNTSQTTKFGFTSFARDVSVDVKFLSIIMGSDESDSTVLDNVNNIMAELHVS